MKEVPPLDPPQKPLSKVFERGLKCTLCQGQNKVLIFKTVKNVVKWNSFTVAEDSATLRSDTSAMTGLPKAVQRCCLFSCLPGNKMR